MARSLVGQASATRHRFRSGFACDRAELSSSWVQLSWARSMTDGRFKSGYDVRRFTGRKPDVPARHTRLLREAFILAAEAAGGGPPDGLVRYLTAQAIAHPVAFLAVLAKAMPLQVQANGETP